MAPSGNIDRLESAKLQTVVTGKLADSRKRRYLLLTDEYSLRSTGFPIFACSAGEGFTFLDCFIDLVKLSWRELVKHFTHWPEEANRNRWTGFPQRTRCN